MEQEGGAGERRCSFLLLLSPSLGEPWRRWLLLPDQSLAEPSGCLPLSHCTWLPLWEPITETVASAGKKITKHPRMTRKIPSPRPQMHYR